MKAHGKFHLFQGEQDMTHGAILPMMLRYAAPLLLGYFFQAMYNTVDTYVVGNYVGTAAYAAVGSVGPIINTLIGFFLGLSAGAGVVLSQYYGARDEASASRTVHTTVLLTAALSVLFTAIGTLMVPFMLRMMQIDDVEVLQEATVYLRTYFSGITGLLFYNAGAGILRAVGDSTRPFLFLVLTAVLNTGLDLFFVLVLHAGVSGVALATILSQLISAMAVVFVLMRSRGCYRLTLRGLRFDFKILRKILKVGLPSAVQMAITSFSNVFVQSYIIHFGKECMAGWTSYAKIDTFALMPMQSLSVCATTFVGQNLGAGETARARRGTHVALALALGATAILLVPIILFAEQLCAIFNSDPAVVAYGARILTTLSPFYLCCCLNQVYAGSLRGAGATRVPMFIMLGSFVLFRQIYLFVISRVANTILWVAMGYPFGWMLCSTLVMLYYRFGHFEKQRVIQKSGSV